MSPDELVLRDRKIVPEEIDSLELTDKVKSAKEFNTHALNRVILYPTNNKEEIESLYLKYMALDEDDKNESDYKAKEIFGKTNKEIYADITGEKSVENVKIDSEPVSITPSNDLPLVTPKELSEKIDENYSCFTESEAEAIKRWRQEYALIGMGIKTENYNKYNLERINILRKAIYENNDEAVIQCGWVPGIEFNSENRVKASELVRGKMNESYIEESFIINKDDLYYNFDKFENGESNILLITGISGSGKSTLGESLSKKYKAQYIELDEFEHADDQIKPDTIFYEYLSKRKTLWDNLKNGSINEEELNNENYKFLNYCISWCKKHKDTKFIIEGIQIYEVFKDKATNYPLIIKNSSVLKSLIQKAVKREKWGPSELKYVPSELKWLIKSDSDLNKLRKSVSESYIEEASNSSNAKAVSIVFVAGSSPLAKTIRKVQGTEFSHASISLDDNLSRIYSYNMRNGFNGFTYESVKNYIKEGVTKMGVYTFLVSNEIYKNLEKSLNDFSLYIHRTKYSVLNLLTIPINVPLDMDMKMVCSEFVDKLLKAAEVDLTNKKSSLVGPKDLIHVANTKSNIVEVFNDHPSKFNPKEAEKKIKKLKRSNLPVYEFVEIEEGFINEAKSFPIQFDSDGNLILKNIRKIDFEQEYADSHRLLKEYEKTESYEPMKFELAKMQFFITLLEKKIYKQGKDKSVAEIKVRARFLNDFKKYLKIVNTNDPDFNFAEYYQKSPFNDALIQIDKDTLKYGFEALKYIIKGWG